MRARRVDAYYGRRLYGQFRRRGLAEVEAAGKASMIAGGSPMAALLRLTVASEQLRPEILAGGAVTEPELAAHAALLDDPAVALMGPVMMRVWGRRPLL